MALSHDNIETEPQAVYDILARRGVTGSREVEVFLSPDFDRDLHSPWLMGGMEAAVARILKAAQAHERVAVYGDYDIDGITATSLMCETLKLHGLDPSSYIPDRFEEGYGLNQAALESLAAQGVTLVISVDCGITSVGEADWAAAHQLDLIITDHHAVPEVVPQAIAVLNPKQAGDAYPGKDLAGVGVAFKLVQALGERTGKPTKTQLKWLMDLVAFGTVCDVVSLTGENRTLVYFGLKVLAQTRRPGIRALATVAGVRLPTIRAHHLGFMLGPRLNAAGRLEHANASLELMMTPDAARARDIAAQLDVLNQQRRADQATILAAATAQALQYPDDPVLVLADAEWSHGVVGIVASKVAEQLGRPALIAQILGASTKGSGRSVVGFNLVEALRARPDLFEKFGGHAFAAGFTLATDRLPELRAHMNEYWNGHQPVELSSEDEADLRVYNPEQLDATLLAAMARLEPFGNGNPEPVIEIVDAKLEQVSVMGSARQHARGRLGTSPRGGLQAVGFGMATQMLNLPILYNVRGHLQAHEYQGKTDLQFIIKDIIPNEQT